ncbi:MAG TPA: outer membrane protein assembly factor BamA [Acidobacteriota bacterium]|nr:outer membrane protein assembly factor BamA [Acidobacteriota bacterium]
MAHSSTFMRIRWFFLALLSLGVVTPLQVQAAASHLSSTLRSPQDESAQQRIVEDVEFRGNRRIPTDTIRLRVSTKPGDIYNRDQVERDYQAIVSEGFFDEFESRVTVEEGFRGGVIIVFVLRERPIIRDIQYEGLKSVQLSDVLTRYREKGISLTKDSQFDPVKVRRAEDELERMLSEKGRPEADVKADIEDISATTVVIVFNVDEGPRVRVTKIDFEGNKVFSDRQLKGAMKLTKQSSLITIFTSKDVYDPGKFENDMLLVRQFLLDRGYLRPVIGEAKVEEAGMVRSRWIFFGKPSRALKITIPIDEGILYRFGDLSVEGSTIFTPEQVLAVSGMKKGDIASGKTIREGVYERLKKAYGSQGYIQAETSLNQDFKPVAPDAKEGVVDFTLNVTEGSVFTIRRIEFLGNSVTRDTVLRRELLVDEGTPYNQELWEYSILRLNQLGFFEEIKKEDAQIQTDERNKEVDINLRVKEKGRQQIQFTGGVSGIGGSFIGITYSTNNLFGYGQSVTVDIQAGNRQRNVVLSYSEPYLFGKPIGLGVSFFSSRLNFVNGIASSGQLVNAGNNLFGLSGETLFTQSTTGASLSLSAPLSVLTRRFSRFARFSRVGISYSFSSTKVIDPPVNRDDNPDNNLLVTYEQPGITSSTISPSFVYNTLNSSLDPTRGTSLSLALSFSGLGGDVKTISPLIEYKYFKSTNFLAQGKDQPAVFGMRFLAQHVSGFGTPFDSNSLSFVGGIPIFSRFFLGGENTIRGYNIRSISPVAQVKNYRTTTNVKAVDVLTGRTLKILKEGQTIRGIDASVLKDFTFTDDLIADPFGFPRFTQVGGDTNLLLNLEYRIPIAGPVAVAMFADAGTVFNLRKLNNQNLVSNALPTTLTPFGEVLNPRGLLATQEEINDSRTPETPPGALPEGFRTILISGDQVTRSEVLLGSEFGGLRRNFRSSLGAEVRVQVPVLQVPFRLIFAYNPNARVFNPSAPDPRLLAIEQKFTVRFTVGRTF